MKLRPLMQLENGKLYYKIDSILRNV